MATRSAGLLLFRRSSAGIEVLIAHMGGPFWAGKDNRAWSIPKGEYDETEDALAAARREFSEELGTAAPVGDYVELGEVRQSNGKVVTAWAVEGDLDVTTVVSNTFGLEWPKGSGRIEQFPEVDRAAWVDLATAREKLVTAQAELIDRLDERLAGGDASYAPSD